MGKLYLVRHGQASLGAADYDNLSELGHRQSRRLGEYWQGCGMRFDAVITGTLKRHRQTWEGIAEGLDLDRGAATLCPGLDEYDAQALIAAIHPGKLEKPDSPELVRHHFRLLRDGLDAWMQARTEPKGMPSYTEFQAGVTAALDQVRSRNLGGRVLLVSSGGPISAAVGHVLGTGPQTVVELNLRMRNTAVTEFTFTPKRHALVTYNTLPHLDRPPFDAWVSYA